MNSNRENTLFQFFLDYSNVRFKLFQQIENFHLKNKGKHSFLWV